MSHAHLEPEYTCAVNTPLGHLKPKFRKAVDRCFILTCDYLFLLLLFRPSVVLGVTNPFFIKTFQSWPHIVRLGEVKMAGTPRMRVHCELPVRVKCHGCQACAVQVVFAVLVVTFLLTYASCL